MSQMIEVYLGNLPDAERRIVIECVLEAGGKLTHEENNDSTPMQKGVCLTFEFETSSQARIALKSLSGKGVHAEGPYDC